VAHKFRKAILGAALADGGIWEDLEAVAVAAVQKNALILSSGNTDGLKDNRQNFFARGIEPQ
jgi:hypothetical protein